MSKLLCNVLKISGGGNAPNSPPWLRPCAVPMFPLSKCVYDTISVIFNYLVDTNNVQC